MEKFRNTMFAVFLAACFLLGVAILWFTLGYEYGSSNGAQYRINRITGKKQWAETTGWTP